MKQKNNLIIPIKTKWIVEEDEELKRLVQLHRAKDWGDIAVKINALFGFNRNYGQCRYRWINHVSPEL